MPLPSANPALHAKLSATAAQNTPTYDVLAHIVDEIIKTMHGDITATDVKIFKQLRDLMHTIDTTRHELASISADEIAGEHLPLATDELEAIVQATEEATNRILEAAEKISAIANTLKDKDTATALTEAVTTIFEASNFQDITGQRITKVVKTMQVIEEKLASMVDSLGGEIKKTLAHHKATAAPDVNNPQSLMSGPQLPAQAISQEDIDALFDSL